MPGTAPTGLRVVRECSVPQSLASVWLVRIRYGVERSSRHQLSWRSAPGTTIAFMLVHSAASPVLARNIVSAAAVVAIFMARLRRVDCDAGGGIFVPGLPMKKARSPGPFQYRAAEPREHAYLAG